MAWSTDALSGPDGEDWRVPTSELEIRQSRFTSALDGSSAWVNDPVDMYWLVGNRQCIPGTTFGIEGIGEIREYLKQAAIQMKGKPVFIQSEHKALYHLSGVMLGNLLASLAAISASLWSQMNIDADTALEALTPMISQVAVNLQSSGIPRGIAGPYVRGDVGTIKSHLEALVKYSPKLLPLYCELALAGLPYAQMNGLNKTNHLDIKKLLETYKSHPEIAN